MSSQENIYLKGFNNYELIIFQLAQIKQALSTSQPSDDNTDLYSLKDDLEELVALTRETLNTLKQSNAEKTAPKKGLEEDKFSEEYALFKVS